MFNKIIDFWFNELEPKQWWQKDDRLDAQIKTRFCELHHQASVSELFDWRESAIGSLAEIIVLDQFSRNIYREKPASFACDALALALAQAAIAKGFDKELTDEQRVFLYMPFMHSESKLIHKEAVKLYKALGIKNNLDFEYQHKAIIDRFNRYPHRNKILGRDSTKEELEFLKQPNSGF
ncbi:DUF924 domain-containing protein [Pseudoalteromonas sp. S1610]|uniref:DUF924 family protein n=1 Tax=Pseudoalteromonas sp. S1610 TaxID=579506 RepID=UPI00110A8609|nr:DUF924 family protein [Pseudoalteromonas sp. S1610]TMP60867.1 DUF924 domain-containing protein [Pseudoalteromonas sp. S1610]|tara:strand:- start:17 stop:553 length:537 start_codon:yes stop_codon:yes gene_type:complete